MARKSASVTRGERPDEKHRTSTVRIPLEPTSKKALDRLRDEYGDVPPEHFARQTYEYFIVETYRQDGEWTVIIEHEGQRFKMPHKVVEQVRRHCDQIISQHRSDRAKDGAETRKAQGLVPFEPRLNEDVEAQEASRHNARRRARLPKP